MARAVPALTVHQWLPTWDEANFSAKDFRSKPPEEFFLASLPASTHPRPRRHLSSQREEQEGLEQATSAFSERTTASVRRRFEYVKFGFPWSSLSRQKRKTSEYHDLVKPGWLPTALVVNILTAEDDRDGQSVDPADLISVTSSRNGVAQLHLPDGAGPKWSPTALPPLEVIDGQHRLWAFDDTLTDYELPVVAFQWIRSKLAGVSLLHDQHKAETHQHEPRLRPLSSTANGEFARKV